jgi:CMP/dCMP kinase
MTTTRGITIAIDGPAGAGKSTVAKRVAQALGYALVDTGAIYRAVALAAEQAGVRWDDDAGLGGVVGALRISFRTTAGVNRVFLDDREITEAIRTPHISMGASAVSARPIVRQGLLQLQRKLAGEGGAVLEGRDIGTVVFPTAPVKIFLDASAEERARRRYRELVDKGEEPVFEEVLADQVRRDQRDQSREIAPLRPAADALILDSTKLSIDEVVDRILAAVRAKAG